MDAYIDVLFCANEETFMGEKVMLIDTILEMCDRNGITDEIIEGVREKIRVKGREEGIAEGREQAMAAIARNLLAKGSTPEFVSDITGLDLETISELRN
jgi:predicted transposase YdaD